MFPFKININLFKILVFVFLILIMISIFLAFKTGYVEITYIIQILKSHTILSPFIFIVIYIILAVSFIPTLPLNLAAGFLWGTFLGTILTLTGAGLGAIVSFYLSRYFFKDKVSKLFKGKIWNYVDLELSKKQWQIVAFTRLNPIFPFGPTSWFFGITKITMKNYIWPTIICIMPAASAFSAIGSSLESFILTGDEQKLYTNVLIASGLVTVLICIKIGFKIYNKKNQFDKKIK